MSKEIIYSFKEYQEKYTLALVDFCINTEFDEIDFITTEIDCYNVYLTSLSVYKRIRHRFPGDPFLDEDTIFLNTNCASYDFIVEALKNKALSESLNTTDGIISNYKIHFSKIILFLETKKSAIGTTSRLGYPATENKQLKKLNDFVFNISDKVTFVQELKLMFPNEKGKTLKAIINILKVQNILIIGDREFKAFYDALKIEFNRDIGTYTSINDVKEIHEQITTPIESKVKLLINKHKTY